MPTALERARESFLAFAEEVGRRAPLYRRLASAIAEDTEIVSILLNAPDTQQRPVLLLAALHDLVLEHPDLPAARHFPSITPDPDRSDPFPLARAALLDHHQRITSIVATRHTQTNEVGRCAPLLMALQGVEDGRTIGLIDIGCSAGLNLNLDRYAYRLAASDASWSIDIAAEQTPRLECAIRGSKPTGLAIPAITTRIGLDARPVDLSNHTEVRWLQACVWPDQVDRLKRLRAAIEVTQTHPVAIEDGDAVNDLTTAIGRVALTELPVVVNSWALAYLTGAQRREYRRTMEHLGSERDLTWIHLEAPSDCPELDAPDDPSLSRLTAVMRTDWRSGQRHVRHIGTMHPHGYWLHVADHQT